MLHLFLKYAKSHIFELHALLAGTIAFLIMFWVKKPIKRAIYDYVNHKAQESAKWEENKAIYIRRFHLLLVVLDFCLSGAIFGVISVISPLIWFSEPMIWLSGVLSVAEYAVFEQFTSTGKQVDYE